MLMYKIYIGAEILSVSCFIVELIGQKLPSVAEMLTVIKCPTVYMLNSPKRNGGCYTACKTTHNKQLRLISYKPSRRSAS